MFAGWVAAEPLGGRSHARLRGSCRPLVVELAEAAGARAMIWSVKGDMRYRTRDKVFYHGTPSERRQTGHWSTSKGEEWLVEAATLEEALKVYEREMKPVLSRNREVDAETGVEWKWHYAKRVEGMAILR
jgi:hypothetical protein